MQGLTVLGSGTIVPSRGHGCSGYLLHGDGGPTLIDCGPGTLCRLADAHVAADSIELVLISHFHLDHVSDLAAFLNSRWTVNTAAAHRIEIVGPPGLREHIDWLAPKMDPWFDDYRLALVELDEREYRTHGLLIRALGTGHTANSICYRITDAAGRSLFYSGDTDYNEDLLVLARHADLAVFECSMPDTAKRPGHLTPRLAATLAHIAEARQLLLTHFYPQVLATDILTDARSHYPGPVSLAHDLAVYPISPE